MAFVKAWLKNYLTATKHYLITRQKFAKVGRWNISQAQIGMLPEIFLGKICRRQTKNKQYIFIRLIVFYYFQPKLTAYYAEHHCRKRYLQILPDLQ